MNYFNPYYEQDFLHFLVTFFRRLVSFFQGNIALKDLATDEIQILVLCGVAASSALTGTFLVLRKQTMMANSLSHTVLLGIIAAYLMSEKSANPYAGINFNIMAMLIASLIVGLLTTFLSEFLIKAIKLQEDASTGIVFTSLFALGIVLVTVLTRDVHIGTEVVMGNVDALHFNDVKLVYIILGLNLVIISLFYKEFQASTFDFAFAKAIGIPVNVMNYILMTLVSATIIGAFRAVGVLMVLTFITGPALTARLLTHSLKKMLVLATLLAILSSFFGVALARHLLTSYGLALSTSGVVVAVTVAFYIGILIFHFGQKKFRKHRDLSPVS